MAVSVAIWSQDLEPNKRNVYTVENDIRISGASLAADLADPNGRTVVEVVIKIPEDYDIDDLPVDEETGERPPMHKFVLCALTAGKIEQQQLDLVLPEGEEIEFVVKGKNPVHLYGNYIQQNPDDDDEDDEDSDEDEFDLEDVPSDVEIDLEDDEELEDSGRFEEVHEEPAPKSAKRAREDEDMADVSTASAADTSATLSKKEKKRAKKLKNEAGKAAPAPTAPTTAAATTPNGKEKKPAEKEAKPAEKKDAKPAEKKDGGKKDGEKKKKSEPKALPGGVTIEDKTIGTGPAAKAGKKIGMRYIGRLKSGKVFDSNTKGKPFFFTLGAGDVIKGWDEGIPGMLVGGERVLTIPAHKGYGKRGAPPDIPPNAELIFEVKLVEVK